MNRLSVLGKVWKLTYHLSKRVKPDTILIVLTLAFTFLNLPVCAQPLISYRGVLNAASFAPAGEPAGSLAQGSLFSIFGTGIGPSTPQQVSAFPLSSNFGGVSLTVTQGSTTVNAIPIYVSANQVNAILPSNTPVGRVALQLTYNGQRSNTAPVTVVPSEAGLFTMTGTGIGPGVVQNFVSPTSQPLNSLKVPAMPGQTVILWATGLGPISGSDANPPPTASLPVNTEAFVGGQSASVLYSGRSGCCSGLDEVVFTVPANAPVGCYVPIVVRTNGSSVSNTVTMSISSDGSPCTTEFDAITSKLAAGGNFGWILPVRFSALNITGSTGPDYIDLAGISFREETGSDWFFNPLASLPPAGTCTAYAANGDLLGTDLLAGVAPSGHSLGAGTSGTIASTNVPLDSDFAALLGTTAFSPPAPILDAGVTLNASGSGGADVGSFNVSFHPRTLVQWTNASQTSTVTRGSPFTITWTGGDPASEAVLIAGISNDRPHNASALFVCVANPAGGSFDVPGYVSSVLLPPAVGDSGSTSYVMVGSVPKTPDATFAASGLDLGTAIASAFSIGEVNVQ